MADVVGVRRENLGDRIEFLLSSGDGRIDDLLRRDGHILLTGLHPDDSTHRASFPAATPHLGRVYENLVEHASDVVLQYLGDVTVPWDLALEAALEVMQYCSARWVLVGSAAMAAQGVDVLPADIDFVTDRQTAFDLGDAFAPKMLTPVTDIPGFGTFGRAFVEARVEWLAPQGDAAPAGSIPSGSVRWRDRTFPASSLGYCLHIERTRGRHDRVAAIQARLDAIASHTAAR